MAKFSQAPGGGEERGGQGRARSWHELAGGQEANLQAMRAQEQKQEQGQEKELNQVQGQADLEALATAEEETQDSSDGQGQSQPGGRSWGQVAREGREQAELGKRLDQLGSSVEGGQEEEGGDSLQPERTMAALGEGESEETDSLQVLYCTLQVL